MGVEYSTLVFIKSFNNLKLKKMSKSKKKSIAKVEEVKRYEITEEQLDKLSDMLSWDNPLSELSDISSFSDETSKLELGFKLGEAYCKLEKMLENCEKILEEVRPFKNIEVPESDDDYESGYDWDDSETEN